MRKIKARYKVLSKSINTINDLDEEGKTIKKEEKFISLTRIEPEIEEIPKPYALPPVYGLTVNREIDEETFDKTKEGDEFEIELIIRKVGEQ